MAALTRAREANYTVSEQYEVDTADHEDHTFCGVMFTLTCKQTLPVEFVEITSISVRGQLGPLTVWVAPEGWLGKHEQRDEWTQVYSGTLPPNFQESSKLAFESPVLVPSGETIGMYVHSGLDGDQSVVYDNQRGDSTHDDTFIQVGPGLAHLSNVPFSPHGFWGRAWRQHRQFVGRIEYGAKYRLWNPDTEAHHSFPKPFKRLVHQLLFLKPQDHCPLSWMSNDVLYYILNMCRWDWVPGLPEDHPPPPSPPEQSSPMSSGDLSHMPRWYRGGGGGSGGFSSSSGSSGSGGGGSTREATAQLRELRAQLFQAQARAMLLQAAHNESQSLRGRGASQSGSSRAARGGGGGGGDPANGSARAAAADDSADNDEGIDDGGESPGGEEEDSDDDSDGLGGGSGTLGGLPASLLWHLRLFGSLGGGNGSGSNRSSGSGGGSGGNSSSPHGGAGAGTLLGTGGAPSPLLPSAWSTPGLTANHSLASSAAPSVTASASVSAAPSAPASGSVSRAPSCAGSAASTPPLPQPGSPMTGRASPPRLLSTLPMHFPSSTTRNTNITAHDDDSSSEVEEDSMNGMLLLRRPSSPPLPPLSSTNSPFPPVLAPPTPPFAPLSASSSLLSTQTSAPTALPALVPVESTAIAPPPLLSSPVSAASAASADESFGAATKVTSPLALRREANDNDEDQ